MKVVWTEKAEQDFASRHPGKKNKRKAGTEVLYDGKTILVSMAENAVYRAYKLRGWVMTVKTPEDERLATGAHITEDEKKERWRTLQELFASDQNYTLREMAAVMGYKSADVVSRLIHNHGEMLVKKYGALPYKACFARWYSKYMESPKKEQPPKVDARVLKQNSRWKILIKDIKKKKQLEEIARDMGCRRVSSVRQFVCDHGVRLTKEIGPLPFSPVMPKYMQRFMQFMA